MGTDTQCLAVSAPPTDSGSTVIESRLTAWLRLSRAELPPIRLTALLERFGKDPERVLAAANSARSNLAELGLSPSQENRLRECASLDISDSATALRRLEANIVTFDDDSYPARLKTLPDAPPILFTRGTLLADDQFSIAIVGSRRASSYGLSIAERFARELTERGLCIVSGGARGVDTQAHRGALAAGGRTVAVIGCGLNVGYPAENRKLFDEIVAKGQGAIVSEYPFGAMPEPWRFPARNRLISGMSMGTLVVESATDSGAMITAGDAADQGRDVFAIPGPIETGRSSGCHKLIQQGAKLVQCPDDIFEEIGLLRLRHPDDAFPAGNRNAPLLTQPGSNIDPAQKRVLEQLTLEARTVDQLAAACGLSAAQVVAVLTLLELRSLARRVPGNAFVRVL